MAEKAQGKEVELKKPTLFLIIGLPGSGKTTKAKEIELQRSALRFTPDEWIIALYGENLDRATRDAVRNPVEQLQWQIAKQNLSHGMNVVLDWGFWTRTEREKYRKEAKAMGVSVQTIFIDVSPDELWKRVSNRSESQKGTLKIEQEDLEEWSKKFEPPTEDELK